MVSMAPPTRESIELSYWFTEHEKRLKRVEAGLRTAQLGNSSLNGNGLNMFDANGNYRGTIGFQEDGNTTVTSVNPLPPPVPGAPTVSPGLAHLLVKHSGETADGTGNPSDFSHLNVYTANVGLPEVRTLRGTIMPVPGEFPVTDLDYTEYLVTVTAVNLSGKESAHSFPASGTPSQAVSADLINGIVQAVHLNSGIVGEAVLAAGAVTVTKIADNSISSPKIIAGAVVAGKLAVDSVNAGNIIAGSVTTEKIAALAVTADELDVNSVTAGKIQAGAITATKLETNMVIATRIIAGISNGARVEMHPTLGLQAYLSNNTTRTFWINASTGQAFFMGEIQTATSGSRIVMNPGGNMPDTIRLYQGANYALIYADPAGSSAGVFMAGAGSNTGKILAQPLEAATAWVTPSLSQSAISCVSDACYIWGGSANMEGRDQYGNGEINFTHRNGSGTLVGSRTLTLRGAGSNEVAAYAPAFGTQIVWTSAGLVVQDTAGNGRQIIASNTSPSSRATKKNLKRFKLSNNRKFSDVVMNLEPQLWNYNNETPPGEKVPNRKYALPRELKRDKDGKLVDDGTGNPVYEDEVMVDAEPEPNVKPHFGLIAEEVMAVLPEIVQENPQIPGGLGLSDRDLNSVLWMTVREILIRLEAKGI